MDVLESLVLLFRFAREPVGSCLVPPGARRVRRHLDGNPRCCCFGKQHRATVHAISSIRLAPVAGVDAFRKVAVIRTDSATMGMACSLAGRQPPASPAGPLRSGRPSATTTEVSGPKPRRVPGCQVSVFRPTRAVGAPYRLDQHKQQGRMPRAITSTHRAPHARAEPVSAHGALLRARCKSGDHRLFGCPQGTDAAAHRVSSASPVPP